MTAIIQLSTDEDIKEYHLKRLYKLSLKSLGEIPELDNPTEEQKKWYKNWRAKK